ncbi:DNA-binding transcriptional regulator, AcrR family [Porphyromonadaceae bacterium KH3CP3RA]|nr:DNA-binding transcriptional regulator, AcrR family [Porphyromonadaceae bacterium KH3CP3RA]
MQTKQSVYMHGSREHIIKKATALFLQKSFKAVTMKEIVESTGLSKGAFYHYFPSKESLFLEIVETYIRMLNIDFDKFSKNSLYEFYHNYIDSSYKKFMQLKEFLEDTNDEDDLTYITLTFDAINLFPGFKEQVRQLHNRELSAWENVIQLAMERGEIKSSMSAMQIAKLFVYVSDGIGQRLIMQGQIKDLKDELLALWNGLYNDLKV